MIYLIDDNQSNQRIDKYNIHYIEKEQYTNILTSIEKLEQGTDLSFLEKASCILLHNSFEDSKNGEFIKGSTDNATKIREIISEEGDKIPLVIFSNQSTDSIYMPHNHYLKDLKKDLFYSRLLSFLEYYKKNNVLEFNILAYGEHFVATEINELITILIEDFLFDNPSNNLQITAIKLIEFNRLAQLSSFSMPINEILENMEDYPITIGKYIEILNRINESFTEYGKNIHDWK